MYKIADFSIELKEIPDNAKIFYKSYAQIDGEPEIGFFCTEEEIAAENNGPIKYSWAYLQYIAFHRKIAEWLPLNGAFVLHSACFDVEGEGVAFAAHSGTGKTTHMNRWREYLGDKMVIVNGDKPIVRFFEKEPNTPYAYGTPWNGKEKLGCNMRTELKHICFIERADSNYVEAVDKNAVVERIFNQVYMPQANPVGVAKTMELIDRLLSNCKLWIIHCNMDENAGEIAYKAIFNK